MKFKHLKSTLATLLVGFVSISSASATPVTTFDISIVADNDFAIFSGNSTNINHLMYQNDVTWKDQISSLSTLNFTLAAGDDTFYVLAIGGGGAQENISGTINDTNITDIKVLMSNNLSSNLTGRTDNLVAAGNYNTSLLDMQTVLSTISWGDTTSNSNQTVIQRSGFNTGYTFATNSALI